MKNKQTTAMYTAPPAPIQKAPSLVLAILDTWEMVLCAMVRDEDFPFMGIDENIMC